jgi:hypothetical protein
MVYVDMNVQVSRLKSTIEKELANQLEDNEQLLTSLLGFLDLQQLSENIWSDVVSPVIEEYDDELIDMENKVEELEEEVETLEENS